jgi:hypothetical protein
VSAVAGPGVPPAPRPPALLERLHRLAAPPPPGPVRPWRLLVLGCLALAALSLIGPNQPTYDPLAWIIWGRETLHLDLVTSNGPSWKPLPWLFTTPFALAGSAAPQLWLVVARGGGLLAFAMAYRLATRLEFGGRPAGAIAGAIAAASLLLADQFVRNFALGNSEGLLVALCLWAVERHLDHRRRDAFALLCAAALLRPEVWPFWALYGVWMVVGAWRARVPRLELGLLVGGALVLAVLWFVPEYFGSGDFLRAAARARQANPDSAAYAAVPFVEVFRRSYYILTPPVYAGAILAVLAAAAAWRRDRGGILRVSLAAGATALMIVVAAMTQAGFAGNLRYVALPASVVCVLAGVGWVDAVRWVLRRGHVVPALALVIAVAFVWAPWVRSDWHGVTVTWDQVRRDSAGDGDLPNAIAAAGGAAAIRRCGPVYTGPFHTPAVAWALGLHLDEVQIFPIPPGTLIAGRRSWLSHDPRFDPVARSAEWRVLRRCERG